MVPVSVDAALLRTRLDSLRTLAGATDGIAVVDANDLNRGLNGILDTIDDCPKVHIHVGIPLP